MFIKDGPVLEFGQCWLCANFFLLSLTKIERKRWILLHRCEPASTYNAKTVFLFFQLSNKSWCRVLGWRNEEGPRALTEAAGGEALRLAATGARDWEAPITLRRRATQDPLFLPCRGAAVALAK